MSEYAPYIDVHSHHETDDGEVHTNVNVALELLRFRSVLPRRCSVGKHPWQAAQPWSEDDAQVLEQALVRPECLALGEVGLDRSTGPAIGLQRAVLTEQLDMAAAHSLPVILHCVRAHADLMQLRKQRGDTNPWIIHGFTGHGELALQLLRMGFSLSFGAALLSTGAKAREALTHVPLDRLLFETDESGLDIRVIYRIAGDVLGVSREKLRGVICENFQRYFGVV